MKTTHKHRVSYGFTLVELIVIITILVILGTIAFVNIGGLSLNARDSSRTADLSNLSKSLEISMLKTGNYPDPDNITTITYSGGILWKQGTIGESVMNILNAGGGVKIGKKPIDPLTKNEYSYSKAAFGRSFQIRSDWEGEDIAYTIQNIAINQANASAGNQIRSYIKGNYNGIATKTITGNLVYVFAIPSLFLSTETLNHGSIALSDNSQTGFLINGQTKSSSGIPFTGSIIFSGATLPSTDTDKIVFAKNIAAAYSGTILSTSANIRPFVEAFASINSGALLGLAESVIKTMPGDAPSQAPIKTIVNTSCKTILEFGGSVGDGMYTLDIDGAGAKAPFSAYCNMSWNGGGWTLAMNLDTSDGQIRYGKDTNYWLSNSYGVGTNFGTGDYKNLNIYNNFPISKIMIAIHENGTKKGWRTWDVINTGNTLYSDFGSNNNRIGTVNGAFDVSSLTGVENVVGPAGDLYFNLTPSDDIYRVYNDGKQPNKIIDGGTTTSNLYGVLGGDYGPYGSPIIQAAAEATSYYTGFGPWSKSFGTDYTANTTGTSQGSCGLNYDYAIYVQ